MGPSPNCHSKGVTKSGLKPILPDSEAIFLTSSIRKEVYKIITLIYKELPEINNKKPNN